MKCRFSTLEVMSSGTGLVMGFFDGILTFVDEVPEYEGGNRRMLNVNTHMRYDDLCESVCQVCGFQEGEFDLKLTCK